MGVATIIAKSRTNSWSLLCPGQATASPKHFVMPGHNRRLGTVSEKGLALARAQQIVATAGACLGPGSFGLAVAPGITAGLGLYVRRTLLWPGLNK